MPAGAAPGLPGRRQARADAAKRRTSARRLLVVVAATLVVLLGVVGFSYYQTSIQPGREWTAKIDGEVIMTMDDVVKTARASRLQSGAVGDAASFAASAYQVLETAIRNALVRDAAPRFGVLVSQEDVDEVLRDRFFFEPALGTDVEPDQLDREFAERYRKFLTDADISDREYRDGIEGLLYIRQMRDVLGAQLVADSPQRETLWIRLPSNYQNLEEVVDSLRAGADMGQMAIQVSQEPYPSGQTNRPAYAGSVPFGAVTNIDGVLFGARDRVDAERALAVGEVSDPIVTPTGTYIVMPISPIETGSVTSADMETRLKQSALARWVEQERELRHVELRMDSERYAWVTERVRATLPATGAAR